MKQQKGWSVMQTLTPFEYFEPETLEEAVKLLAGYGGRGRLLAGGVDLIPRIRLRTIKPEYVVNIQRIPGLDYIKGDGKTGVTFGPLTAIRSIEVSPVIQKDYMILYEAAHQLPSVQVKTMGTLIGNLCVGTPASDMATALYALGANLKIVDAEGEKTMPIEDFYLGPGQTALRPGEIVSEVSMPGREPGTGGSYQHLVRTRADISKVCVAVTVTMRDGTCGEARIALGAVAPTVLRAGRAEAILKGKKIDQTVIEKAAGAAAEETKPITDIRSTAEYRRETTKVLVKRAIAKAVARASRN
jgi:carbon-monoxide dehydrogenase medium subunit